uniref:F-box domain-containing protein n=1 Tax=Fagus sylvatica TaxID=28930 RepID=A0A2N9FM30_FAGSY
MMSQPWKKPMWSSQRLPDEIVFDILTRVPVKSLIRFRCVSKSWYSSTANPIFITAHFNQAQSLSNNNHNGYLLYESASRELCSVICNSDYTLTHISSFEIPFSGVEFVGFCNGIFCLHKCSNNVLYLWNPSIRKFKMLNTTRLCVPAASENVSIGLAYHSHNNDFKILRIKSYKVQPPAAEVYTLSTDSWRWVEIPFDSLNECGPDRLFGYVISSPCLFLHGALHSIAKTPHHDFILAFDVNDEKFREIMLPRNYLDGIESCFERLVVFKGSLALFAYGDALDEGESYVERFCGCTNNGGLLIEALDDFLVAFDPETLNKNDLGIPNSEWEDPISSSTWMDCTANFVESLVLLDGTNV